MSGHAIAGTLHLVASVLWVGSVTFVSLFVLPWYRTARDPLRHLEVLFGVVKRFEPVGVLSLATLFATGVYMTFGVYDQRLPTLLGHAFGVKITLMFGAMLGMVAVMIVSDRIWHVENEGNPIWRRMEGRRIEDVPPAERHALEADFRALMTRALRLHLVAVAAGLATLVLGASMRYGFP